jgi:type 1 glutamine amidotransferase
MKTKLLSVFLASLGFLPSPALQASDSAATPGGWDRVTGKRVLYFTKSAGFEHSVVKRTIPDQLSFSEKILTELGKKHGFRVNCTKDGSVFTPDNLAPYDVITFYTSGDLLTTGTDGTPAMTMDGKKALLDAVQSGKGFAAIHPSSDSFHYKSTSGRDETFVAHGTKVDPYIVMLGGEFVRHGPQQIAKTVVVDNQFPGCEKLRNGFELMEEWYTFKDFAPDMHVILDSDPRA